VENPGPYRWANNGAAAKEHLQLRLARENAGKAEADTTKAPVVDDALDAETATDAGEAEAAPTAEAEAIEPDLTVPDDAEGYADAQGVDRFEWANDDPLVTQYAEFLHSQGMPAAAYQSGLAFVDKMRADRQAADAEQNKTTKTRLRSEWVGDGEYVANVAAIRETLAGMGEFGALLRSARLANGDMLINHKSAAHALLALAPRKSSNTAPAPSLSGDEARLAQLKEILHNDASELYRRKNAKGQTLDAEMLEIQRRIDARNRGRSAA